VIKSCVNQEQLDLTLKWARDILTPEQLESVLIEQAISDVQDTWDANNQEFYGDDAEYSIAMFINEPPCTP
jgi:hypothetical protein